jgi:hypothetical protein
VSGVAEARDQRRSGESLKIAGLHQNDGDVAVEVEREADRLKRRLIYAMPGLALKSETVIE